MEMHYKPDHCKSADDVMDAALSAAQRRKRFFAQSAVPKNIKIAEQKIKLPSFPPQEQFIEITAVYLASFDPPALIVEFGEYQPRPTIKQIQKLIAIAWKISRHDLLSRQRTLDVVVPRQIGFVLSRALTFHSSPEIGREWGDRDHTTVLHGIKKYYWLLKQLRSELLPQQPLSRWVWRAKELIELK